MTVMVIAVFDLFCNSLLLAILAVSSKDGFGVVYQCSEKIWYMGLISISYYGLVVLR